MSNMKHDKLNATEGNKEEYNKWNYFINSVLVAHLSLLLV